jgi:hypothetical protein
MKTRLIVLAAALLAILPAAVEARSQDEARTLLDRYCVTCHNERTKAGSLVLQSADLSRVGEDGGKWEKVVRKLRGRLMPPAGRPRPDDAAYESFTAWLETELDTFAAAHPNPGRPETFRRLNRTEYQNAIRDLLGLDIDVSGYVPADDSAHGFDNIGGVFKLSPALLERYLSAAKKISRMAMGTPPSVTDEGQVYLVPRMVQQHDRVEGLGLGTRGGMLVRHLFPQNGEYTFRIDVGNTAIIQEPHTMELTLDGEQVKEFTVIRVGDVRQTLIHGDKEIFFEARLPVSAGPHDVGVAFYANPPAVPETILEPLQISALSNFGGGGSVGPGGVAPVVKGITVGGPFGATGPGATPSRRRLLVCRPATPAEEAGCARSIISLLARRAFRRPVSDADLKPLVSFYAESRAGGDGFEPAIEKVLRRVLASPEFLFHMEAEPAAAAARGSAAYRISDIELASRLSFLLWSSIPDDRLLDLAEKGQLKQPAVLAREVRRMMADERSKALTTSFASQWLQLRKMESSRPGANYGKNFDGTLREGLQRETELFVDSVMRHDRPVTELLTADYTFLNERVAQHYGIRDVQGSHFRRVTLPANNPRRGLLGHGSILTLTSQAIRTSPVTRGKYILETIMGTPPPEPPPDVPSLTEAKAGTRPKSMRERMAAHRANAVCATCHSMIDPLGFGLENFDAVGSWRDVDESFAPIDPSGVLPDGRKFGGVTELRTLLAQHPEQLVTTVTERLLTYALARGLEPYDMPAVRKIVRDARRSDYRFHSVVLGIVTSYPFQMRSGAAAGSAVSASR